MSIILTALSDDIAAEVADMQYPRLMLDTLKTTHRHLCDTTVETLKRKYLSSYFEQGDDMMQHVHQTRIYHAELLGYKVEITDASKRSEACRRAYQENRPAAVPPAAAAYLQPKQERTEEEVGLLQQLRDSRTLYKRVSF